jgi:hypothetical protein
LISNLCTKNKTESVVPASQPIPQLATPLVTANDPIPEVKIEDISYSEDDLMKLKKINFKKKVSGKLLLNHS